MSARGARRPTGVGCCVAGLCPYLFMSGKPAEQSLLCACSTCSPQWQHRCGLGRHCARACRAGAAGPPGQTADLMCRCLLRGASCVNCHFAALPPMYSATQPLPSASLPTQSNACHHQQPNCPPHLRTRQLLLNPQLSTPMPQGPTGHSHLYGLLSMSNYDTPCAPCPIPIHSPFTLYHVTRTTPVPCARCRSAHQGRDDPAGWRRPQRPLLRHGGGARRWLLRPPHGGGVRRGRRRPGRPAGQEGVRADKVGHAST